MLSDSNRCWYQALAAVCVPSKHRIPIWQQRNRVRRHTSWGWGWGLVGDLYPSLPHPCLLLSLAGGGVSASLPKHLFHQPSYLSFDTGASLPCLLWVSQVLLQLRIHLNLNCITQVYFFFRDYWPLQWEKSPPHPN